MRPQWEIRFPCECKNTFMVLFLVLFNQEQAYSIYICLCLLYVYMYVNENMLLSFDGKRISHPPKSVLYYCCKKVKVLNIKIFENIFEY